MNIYILFDAVALLFLLFVVLIKLGSISNENLSLGKVLKKAAKLMILLLAPFCYITMAATVSTLGFWRHVFLLLALPAAHIFMGTIYIGAALFVILFVTQRR